MSSKAVTIEAESAQLNELLILVEKGQEIIIARGRKPVAKLVAISHQPQRRTFGMYAGKIRMTDDFAEPLPEDYWLGNGSS